MKTKKQIYVFRPTERYSGGLYFSYHRQNYEVKSIVGYFQRADYLGTLEEFLETVEKELENNPFANYAYVE